MDTKILHDWEMELDSNCDTPSSSDTGNCDTPSSSEWNMSFSEDDSEMEFDSDFFDRPRKGRNTNNQPKNQTTDDQMSCIETFITLFLVCFAIFILTTTLWQALPGARWPSIVTINTTATVVSTTTATATATPTATATSITPRHIVPKDRPLPDGVPRSLGHWKQMARKIYYYDCLQGCEAVGANCDFWNPGKWEKACQQTDNDSYGDVDCSAANLLEAAGGRRGDEVPIPEVCLYELAKDLQGWRVHDVERKQREGK